MSDSELFFMEVGKIDELLASGHRILMLQEDLDGTEIRFEKTVSYEGMKEKETLILLHPDSRRYVAVRLLQQLGQDGAS